MKGELLLLILLVLLPTINASIVFDVSPLKIYKVGQSIDMIVTVFHESPEQIFFNSQLHCQKSSIDYFKIPLDSHLPSNKITIPSLTMTSSFVGNCSIIISLTTLQNIVI